MTPLSKFNFSFIAPPDVRMATTQDDFRFYPTQTPASYPTMKRKKSAKNKVSQKLGFSLLSKSFLMFDLKFLHQYFYTYFEVEWLAKKNLCGFEK